MTAEALLARLERVRKTGRDRWLACCPCHDSASRSSLAIRELPDGRVLLHDFGGCPTADVLAAVGLDFDALFPERVDTSGEADGDRRYRSRASRPWHPMDVLAAVADEVLVAQVILAAHRDHPVLTADERVRLATAAGRLATAVEYAHGC